MENNNSKETGTKRIKYTFLDELPGTAGPLSSYGKHELNGVYIDYPNKKVYLFNGVKYKELVAYIYKGNSYYQVLDIENKQIKMSHKLLFDWL